MTVIPLSLKTMESLRFGATALFSIRLLSLAHRSVVAALMLTLSVNEPLFSMFAKCVQKFQLLNRILKMKRVKKSVIILLFLMRIFTTSEWDTQHKCMAAPTGHFIALQTFNAL